jgi:hypothetical protein
MENLGQYLLPNHTSLENSLEKEREPCDSIDKLLMDLNNIRETQMQYGMPAIGDLFKSRPQDI